MSVESISPENAAIMEGLCNAFERCNEFTDTMRKGMFHLRDFVYLLRYLHKHCKPAHTESERVHLTPAALLQGLERNFNGLRRREFQEMVGMWFNEINDRLRSERLDPWPLPREQQFRSSLALLKESLADRVADGENPNMASFRYILVIDPTDTQAALSLLRSQNVVDTQKISICHLGDFVDDDNEFVHMKAVQKVKEAMANEGAVILANSQAIDSCFYDLFNRHFSVLRGDKKKDGEAQQRAIEKSGDKEKGTPEDDETQAREIAKSRDELDYQYFANVAIGSYSRPCIVHRNFKVIVHLPESVLKTTPFPFLNRFEKYYLSIEDALEATLQRRNWETFVVGGKEKQQQMMTVFDVLREGANDFIDKLHMQDRHGRLLYGAVPNETVASFLLAAAEQTLEHTFSTIPEIPPAFHVAQPTEEITTIEEPAAEQQPQQQDLRNSAPSGDDDDDAEFQGFAERHGEKTEAVEGEAGEELRVDITSSMVTRTVVPLLREKVRQANFHLLQLARPESVFFCRQLPHPYMQV